MEALNPARTGALETQPCILQGSRMVHRKGRCHQVSLRPGLSHPDSQGPLGTSSAPINHPNSKPVCHLSLSPALWVQKFALKIVLPKRSQVTLGYALIREKPPLPRKQGKCKKEGRRKSEGAAPASGLPDYPRSRAQAPGQPSWAGNSYSHSPRVLTAVQASGTAHPQLSTLGFVFSLPTPILGTVSNLRAGTYWPFITRASATPTMLVAVTITIIITQWHKISGGWCARLWEIDPFLFCRSGKAHPVQVLLFLLFLLLFFRSSQELLL